MENDMPVRYAGNDNRITYGKTPIKSIMQGETAVYGEDVFAKQPLFTYSETQNSVTITGLTDLGKTRENIIIPSQHNAKVVTSIGDRAFQFCDSLTSITIPAGVTSIGELAFNGCSSLESITVEEGNAAYHSAGNCIIETATKTLVVGCKSSVIPDDGSVTSIGDNAFSSCSGLTSVTIPDSVTSIGDNAFSGCDNLQYNEYGNALYLGNDANPYLLLMKAKDRSITSVNIHDATKLIYEYAFYNCTSLTSVTLGNGVTSIGRFAFHGCDNLQYNEYDKALYLGNEENRYVVLIKAIYKSITSVRINASTKVIYDSAFEGCTSLTRVTMPDSVTSIGYSAFESCTSLSSVTIPDSVTSIGGYAFLSCGSLTSITIPDSVTSIGGYAFRNCTSLTSVTLGNGVTSIGYGAFWNCISLAPITIPGSVISIGNYAFRDCDYLTSVTIPGSVISIGNYAFWNCISLGSVTFTGTITQWNVITKGSGWNRGCPFTQVVCSDGTVSV